MSEFEIASIGPVAIAALVVAGLTMIVFILYASWLAPTYQFNEDTGIPDPLTVNNLTVNQNAQIDALTVTQTATIDVLTVTQSGNIDSLTVPNSATINTLTVSNSATIDGLVTPSVQNAEGGIKFGLGAGLPVGFVQGTLLDYGTYTTSGNFTGPIILTAVPDITFFVCGALVTMVVPRFATLSNNTAALLTGTSIVPLELRPPGSVKNSVVCTTFPVSGNSNVNVSAFCQVDPTNGNLLIAPNFQTGVYTGTVFPASGAIPQVFIIENFSMSWKM
jgi:hypothetical protein